MFAIRCVRFLVGLALAVVLASTADAQVKVRGYTRKDGTYVKPHHRSNPDGNFWNNWSTIGNVNPYTGQPGTKRTPPPGYGGYGVARSGFGLPDATPAGGLPEGSMFSSGNPSSSIGPEESSYESMYGGLLNLTPWERELERKRRLAEQRRDEEKARREKSRESIPVRDWTDEELAKSRFKVAHLLYQGGRIDSSKNVLKKLLDEFPQTETAERAQLVLTKF